jgi:integrase
MAKKGVRGWHASGGQPPRRGAGSATVEPIRTKKDLAKVKAALANRPRDLALFVVGVNSGLRGSDLLALRWDHVLTPEGRIKSVMEVRESKTNKLRRIVVNDSARKALEAWRRAAGEVLRDDFVFPSRKGHGRMTIQRLHQLVNDWTTQAGLTGHYGSHSMRKTFGLFHYKNGVGLPLLMKIFGHSSEAITLRYIGLEQKEIDEANLRLDL